MDEQSDSVQDDKILQSKLKHFWLRRTLAVGGIVILFGFTYWLITTPSLPAWTNFNDKGLWDVLELIIVPIGLAIGGYFLSTRQKATELEIAQKGRESEQRIAKDREEEQALQTYFSEMSKLLLEHQLIASKEDSEQRSIARSRTLTTLRRLNPERKAALLLFLYESKLIDAETSIVSLSGANLAGANLAGAQMQHARLQRARLPSAKLADANLEGAALEGANLASANLARAFLRLAHLASAQLPGADLRYANLTDAHLADAHLAGAFLSGAFLPGADLRYAQMQQTQMQRAQLQGALLTSANLEGATLEGAILVRANLVRANLAGANLAGALLERVQQLGALLEPAQQLGALLERVQQLSALLAPPTLADIYYDNHTIWPDGFTLPKNTQRFQVPIVEEQGE